VLWVAIQFRPGRTRFELRIVRSITIQAVASRKSMRLEKFLIFACEGGVKRVSIRSCSIIGKFQMARGFAVGL
jgi:hypothetical protein